jgi:SpoVK/Ycf46/Vps4 family AAA+-type ATPase
MKHPQPQPRPQEILMKHPHPITVIEHNSPGIGASHLASALAASDLQRGFTTVVVEANTLSSLSRDLAKLTRPMRAKAKSHQPVIIIAPTDASQHELDDIVGSCFGTAISRTIALFH